MNVDLAVTAGNQVVLYLEEPVSGRVARVDFRAEDGRVALVLEGQRTPLELAAPVAPDLRPAFRQCRQAAIGHVTADGALTLEYAAPILVRSSPPARPGGGR